MHSDDFEPRGTAIGDGTTLTRRALLRVGLCGVTVLIASPLAVETAAAGNVPIPVNEFRLVALNLPGVSDAEIAKGVQSFERHFADLPGEWQNEYERIFRAAAGRCSKPPAKSEARRRVRQALSDPGVAELTQTAVNLADVLTPGDRFRNDIDDVVIDPESSNNA